jgi:hypothetical protein
MAWNDLTFDEVQSVFHNWMNRLRWVIENGGSTLLNKDGSVYLCLLSDGIGGGPGTFFTLCISSSCLSCNPAARQKFARDRCPVADGCRAVCPQPKHLTSGHLTGCKVWRYWVLRHPAFKLTCGTISYTGLECGECDGSKADIWSLSVVIFTICAGRRPVC